MSNAWDLGIPSSPPDCAHSSPTFGCDCCIKKQVRAWEQAKFEEFVKTHKPQKCPRCKTTMKPYCTTSIDGKLNAVVACQNFTKDGEYICEDYDYAIALE